MSRAFRVGFALILVAASLAGCGVLRIGVDAEQARICRLTLPALNGDAVRIAVLAVAPALEPHSLRISYRVERQGRPPRSRSVTCRFAAEGLAANKADLVALATESGPVTGASLYLLKRFWLDSPESAAADPGPGEAALHVAEAPAPLAYAAQQIVAGLPRTAIYGLLASAYALVFGLVGRINLAFGELTAVGAAGTVIGVGVLLRDGMTAPLPGFAIGLLGAVFAAAIYGAVGGWFTIARIGGASGQPSLIATVGLSIALMEYLRLVQGPIAIWIPPVWSDGVPVLRAGDFVVSLTPMSLLTTGIGLIAASLLIAAMRATGFGRAWRAYADDPRAAALFGVDGKLLLLHTLALSGGLAGLAGTLIVAQYGGLGFAGGFQFGLKALVAAVLGGIGSVAGALAGGVAIGAFETVWSAYLPLEGRDIALYAALIVVLVLRPGGLFGQAEPGRRGV